MTHAESRRINGAETYNRVSRFVKEIPEDLVQEVRLSNVVTKPADSSSRAGGKFHDSAVEGTNLKLGQRVKHNKFGEGIVLNYEGTGKQARVQVNFNSEGSKWLMMAYANLQPV